MNKKQRLKQDLALTSKQYRYKMQSIHYWNQALKPHEYTQRRMEFGKYIGQQIKNIPDDYIKWGIKNLDTTWATLFSRELQRRCPQYKRI